LNRVGMMSIGKIVAVTRTSHPRHHSRSLSKVEIEPVEGGARLIDTEQTAYHDGTASRERGVGWRLDGPGDLPRRAR